MVSSCYCTQWYWCHITAPAFTLERDDNKGSFVLYWVVSHCTIPVFESYCITFYHDIVYWYWYRLISLTPVSLFWPCIYLISTQILPYRPSLVMMKTIASSGWEHLFHSLHPLTHLQKKKKKNTNTHRRREGAAISQRVLALQVWGHLHR